MNHQYYCPAVLFMFNRGMSKAMRLAFLEGYADLLARTE